MVTYEVTKGETITLPFVVTEGDITTVTEISSRMRRLSANGAPMFGEVAIALEIDPRAATELLPAGWNLFLSQ